MKKLTKIQIEQLAKEIMDFLDKCHMQDGVCIYFNNKRMRSDGNWDGKDLTYSWVEEDDVDPHDYFEYAAYEHILSMSFEGALYDVLNYTFGKREEKFRAIFEKYGLYFELGNYWNLSAYLSDDDMEVEYTIYEQPKETIYLHRGNPNNPAQLNNVMDMWYACSSISGEGGSCVLGAGLDFEWEGDKYFMPAQSPHQGSLSWEKHVDVVKATLKGVGATNIYYNWGRMD